MPTGFAGRGVVVCLVVGATVLGCDCGETRLKGVPPDKSLRIETAPVVSCDGLPVRLAPIVVGGKPPYAFHWEPAAHVTSADALATTADADDTRTYTLTVTDAQGVSVTSETKVERRQAPVPSLKIAQGRALGCAGESVTLDGSASRAFDGSPVARFEWDLGSGPETGAATSRSFVPSVAQTVHLKVVDVAGCFATASLPLDVRAPPTPAVRFVRGSASVCPGTAVALDGATSKDAAGKPVAAFAWDLDGDASTVEGTSAATDAFVPTGAPARLTVTDDLGCSASVEAAIALAPLPTARIRLDQASPVVCAGAQVGLDGSASTDASGAPVAAFAWDFDGDGSLDSSDAKPLPFTASGPRRVRLTVTDARGCTNDRSLDVTPRALPQLPVAMAAGRADGCVGDRVQLSAAGAVDADGNAVAAFAWDVDGDGTADSTGSAADVTLAGRGTARVTVVDALGCSAQSAIELAPHALPTVVTEFVAGSSAVCAGETVALDGSKSHDETGAAVAAYAWELDGDETSVEGTEAQSGSWKPSGTPAKLTVTDVNGCRASAVVPITVRALPKASVNASATGSGVCVGGNVTLDASASRAADGTDSLQFAWDLDGDPTTVDSTSSTPAPLRVDRPSVAKITVTDVFGCSADASVSFEPRANPVIPALVVSGSPTGCTGDDLQLSAAAARDADGNAVGTFAWDFDGDGTADSMGESAIVKLATAQTVSVEVTDLMGCTSKSAIDLAPHALPTVVTEFITGSSAVCAGEAVVLDGSKSHDETGAAVASFAWDLDGDEASIESTIAQTASWKPSGTPAKLTVTDVNGCHASAVVPITVRALPKAIVNASATGSGVCVGGNVTLDASASRAADGTDSLQFAWDLDGDPTTVNSTSSTPAPLRVDRPSVAKVTVTDVFGCSADASVSFEPRANPVIPSLVVSGSPAGCTGDDVQLSAAAARDADGNAVGTFAWDFDGDGTADSMGESAIVKLATAQTVSVEVTDLTGCTSKSAIDLAPHALPTVVTEFITGSSAVCAGEAVVLDGSKSHDETGAAVASFAWDLDGDEASIESTVAQTASWKPSGTPAKLTVTDVNGCHASAVVPITVRGLPKAIVNASATGSGVCVGGNVTLDASASRAADGTDSLQFAWDLDGDPTTVDSTSSTPAPLRVDRPSVAKVTVTDVFGCSADASVSFEPRANPVIPALVVSGSPTGCTGDDLQLSVAAARDADGNAVGTFAWDLDGDGTADSTGESAIVKLTAAQTVSVKVTDAMGCTSQAALDLTPHALPTVVTEFVTGASAVCAGEAVVLDGSKSHDETGAPVAAYAWDLDGNAASIESTIAQSAAWKPSGTPAKLTVTDVNGCRASAVVPITVRGLPKAILNASAAGSGVCVGGNVTLDASASQAADGTGSLQFAWDLDGDPTTVDSTSSTPAPLRVDRPSVAKVTVTDVFGCSSDASVSFEPRANPVIPSLVVGGSPTGCTGDALQLSAAAARDADGNAVGTFAWDVDGDGTADSTSETALVTLASAQTVSVKVTDAKGCTSQAALALAPHALPTVVTEFVTGTTAVCAGETVVLDASKSHDETGASVAAYAWDLDGNAASIESTNAQSAAWKPAGAPAKLTVTDVNGCRASAVVPITVRALPKAIVNASATGSDMCVGSSVTLDATRSASADGTGALEFAWDLDGDPTTVDSTSPTPAPLRVDRAGAAKVTVTDVFGCSADASVSFTPRPNPVIPPLVVSGDPTGCLGDEVQLSAAGARDADGNPVGSFAWDLDGDGNADSNADGAVVTLATAGTVSVQVTDAQGCSTSAATTLVPRALPTPRVAFTTGAASVCAGAEVALDASDSVDADGQPVTSYAWDLDADPATVEGAAANTGHFVPTGLPARLTIADRRGCRASLVTPLTARPLPTASIEFRRGSSAVCDGTIVAVDGAGSTDASGGPVFAYAWDFDSTPATVESTLAEPPPFVTAIGRDIRLTVTDATGCTAEDVIRLTSRRLPEPVLRIVEGRENACLGDAVKLSAAGSRDADGQLVTEFLWDYAELAGSPVTAETTPSFVPASSEVVAVTVVDSYGCRATATQGLAPRSLPSPNIAFASGRADVCAGGSVALTSAGSRDADGRPVTTVAWDLESDGLVDANGIVTPAFVPASAQTAQLVVTDDLGCRATATQAIAPRALPVADLRFARGGALVCRGGEVQFDASGSRDADGNVPATLAWDTNGDGTTDATGAATSAWTLASATAVGLTVTDRLGCTSSARQDVTVRALPTARITFEKGAAAVCSGATVQVAGTGSTDADGAPVASYSWDFDGDTSTVESIAGTPDAFALTSAKVASLTVTDAQGCRNSATQNLGLNPSPVANAGADAATCAGGSVRLGGAAVAGTTYAWTPATGLSNATASNPMATPSAGTTYTVTATNAFGCTASDDVTVNVRPLPTVDAGPDRTVALGGSVSLLASASGSTAPYAYAWTPGASLTDASILRPRAMPTRDTRYDLTVTDANGCSASDSLFVFTAAPLSVNAGPDLQRCRDGGKALALTAKVTSGVGALSYAWTSSPDCGGCIAGAGSATASVSPLVDTTFTVTVTDENGTTASDSVFVRSIAGVSVDAGPDRAVSRGGSTQLGGAGIPGLSYSWSCSRSNCGLSDYTAPNPTVQPDGTTVYTVVATDGATCTAQDTVVVTTDPGFLATVPPEGHPSWSRDAPIFVLFDGDMDPASFAGNVSLLDPSDGTFIWISSSYDVASRTLLVQPLDTCGAGCTGDHKYKNNRPHLLTVKGGTGGVRSASGVTLYNDLALEFVASSLGDGSAPKLAYGQPAAFEVGVMTTTQVVLKFDEPCDPRTVSASTIQLSGVAATVSYDPRTWTAVLKPAAPLAPNRSYVVSVIGVKDGSGNATNFSWNFTTGPAGDTAPPSVVTSSPANGATAVDVAGTLSVTFSEPIDTATIGRLKVTDVTAGAAIAGRVLYDEATRVLTFEPKSFLEPQHQFRLDLAGFTDQAGNALAAWSATFTTGSTLISERFETLPTGWTFQSPWALDTQAARAGSTGLSDSPGTRYANSATRIATTPSLNVAGKTSVSISLWTRRTLDTNADTAYVETSPDGTTWTTASTLTGPTGWRTHSVSVPTNGKPKLFVRLRLVSDASVNLDGWFVDDFVVR